MALGARLLKKESWVLLHEIRRSLSIAICLPSFNFFLSWPARGFSLSIPRKKTVRSGCPMGKQRHPVPRIDKVIDINNLAILENTLYILRRDQKTFNQVICANPLPGNFLRQHMGQPASSG